MPDLMPGEQQLGDHQDAGNQDQGPGAWSLDRVGKAWGHKGLRDRGQIAKDVIVSRATHASTRLAGAKGRRLAGQQRLCHAE